MIRSTITLSVARSHSKDWGVFCSSRLSSIALIPNSVVYEVPDI